MEKKIASKKKKLPQKSDEVLIDEIRSLIEQTRSKVAQTVNSALVLMNWHIGKRINEEILQNKRAEYGNEIVSTLSQQLTAEYGKGFSRQNLFHCMRFAETFSDIEIVSTLSRQLGWSHFKEIIYQKESVKTRFLRGNVPP